MQVEQNLLPVNITATPTWSAPDANGVITATIYGQDSNGNWVQQTMSQQYINPADTSQFDDQINANTATINSLSSQIASIQTQLSDQTTNLQNQITQMQAQIASLTAANVALTAQKAAYEAQFPSA